MLQCRLSLPLPSSFFATATSGSIVDDLLHLCKLRYRRRNEGVYRVQGLASAKCNGASSLAPDIDE